MRRYETMVIVDSDVAEQERTELFDRLGELIAAQSGYLVENDEWGSRKLAYPIKKKPRGFYLRLDYCGTGDLVTELERNLRIEDRVLKYMTVQLEEDADVEALKEAVARREAEEAAAQQQQEAEREKAEEAAAQQQQEAEHEKAEESTAAVESESEAALEESSSAPAAQPPEPTGAEAETDTSEETPTSTSEEGEVKEGA